MIFDYKAKKLSLILLTISLIVCGYLVWHYREMFVRIFDIEVQYLIILSGLFTLVQLVNGYKIFVIVQFFGSKMKTLDWVGLPYMTSYLNYLPGNAGSGITAVFLKKKYNLPYTKFISVSGALFVLYLFCFSTACLVLMGIIWATKGYTNGYLASIFALIIVSIVGLRFLPIDFIKGQYRASNWFRSILRGFDDIRKDHLLVGALVANSYVQLFLLGMIIHCTFLALGFSVNYLDGLLLGIITSISKFQYLIPGQLGIREVFIASAAKLIQGSFGEGIVVAVTDRIVSGVITIIFGNIFILTTIKKIQNWKE